MMDPGGRPLSEPGRSGRIAGTGTGWLAAGAVVGGLGAYGFQVVATHALDREAYAPIGTLWTIQYLVWSVVLLAVETLVVRETLRAPLGAPLPRPTAIGGWRWIVGAAAVVTASCWLLRERLFYGVGELSIVAGSIVLGFGALAVVRGRLAGRGRYRVYGLVSAAESIVRLGLAAGIAIAGASTCALAWTLPVGAAAAASSWIVLGPSGRGRAPTEATRVPRSPEPPGAGRFLLPATMANGATQLLLAGGPIAMVAISASPSELSVFFVTLTAARVPVVVALGGGLSRLLPVFTGILARRGPAALPRIAALVAGAAALLAAIGGGAAAAVGGPLIGALFGTELSPPGWLAAATTVGVVLATGGLVLNQLLIAAGSERRLVAPWAFGLMSAIATMLIVAGTPSWRVGISFVVGEMAALGALVAVARFAARRLPPP